MSWKDQLQLHYVLWRTRNLGEPDLTDGLGFPHWLWEDGDLDEGSMYWQYSDGRDISAIVRMVWSAEDNYLKLGDINIKPRYWGRGIGSRLIKCVKEFSIELGKKGVVGEISELDVYGGREHPPQPNLMDWYRRRGFQVTMYARPRGVMIASIFWERA